MADDPREQYINEHDDGRRLGDTVIRMKEMMKAKGALITLIQEIADIVDYPDCGCCIRPPLDTLCEYLDLDLDKLLEETDKDEDLTVEDVAGYQGSS